MLSISQKNTIQRWRVSAGYIGAILAILLSKPKLITLIIGFIVFLIGLFLRAWASGYLEKNKELTVSGPYRYTRNPLYLGNFIWGIGMVLGSYSWWVFLIFGAYFILFYPLTIKMEKERMEELFPGVYEEYKKKVPLFFPMLKPYPMSGKRTFSWRLYKTNKEYRALIAGILFWAALSAKFVLFL